MANTPYYSVPVPTVGADFDTWGVINNNAHTAWDAALSAPTNTIKGRNDAGTGVHENLTPTEVTAMLSPVVGDSGSGGTKGLVPAVPAGSAAKKQYLMADGSFAQEVEAWGSFDAGGAVTRGRNVSASKVATGIFDVTFPVPMSDSEYAIQFSYFSTGPFLVGRASSKTTSGFRISWSTAGGADTDPSRFFIETRV